MRISDWSSDVCSSDLPQSLVPWLVDEEAGLGQSLAIIEYLDEVYPDPPLIPGDSIERAKIRSMAQIVACDIHPINNLRVLKHLRKQIGLDQEAIDAWARHWIEAGFATLEAMAGPTAFLAGPEVTLADICLVPQLYNARRVATDLSVYPSLLAIETRLLQIPAFDAARPEMQAEAEPI